MQRPVSLLLDVIYVYKTNMRIKPYHLLKLSSSSSCEVTVTHVLALNNCRGQRVILFSSPVQVELCHHLSTAMVTHKNGLKLAHTLNIYTLYIVHVLPTIPCTYSICWSCSLSVIWEEERPLALCYRLAQCHVWCWSMSVLLQYEQRGIN